MKAFNKIVCAFRKITGAFGLIGAVALFLMVAVTFSDVILRYFFHFPIRGSQELVEFLMIITMYGGMPYAAAKGMLISVDAVVKKFHPTVRKLISLFFTILSAAGAILLCVKTTEQFLYHNANPLQTTAILQWSQAPFYLFTAIGLCLLSIEMLFEIVLRAAEFGKGPAPALGEEGASN